MIPAVEDFTNLKNPRTFLSGDFIIAKAPDASFHCHRCFVCFPTDREEEERATAVGLANARPALVYEDCYW